MLSEPQTQQTVPLTIPARQGAGDRNPRTFFQGPGFGSRMSVPTGQSPEPNFPHPVNRAAASWGDSPSPSLPSSRPGVPGDGGAVSTTPTTSRPGNLGPNNSPQTPSLLSRTRIRHPNSLHPHGSPHLRARSPGPCPGPRRCDATQGPARMQRPAPGSHLAGGSKPGSTLALWQGTVSKPPTASQLDWHPGSTRARVDLGPAPGLLRSAGKPG